MAKGAARQSKTDTVVSETTASTPATAIPEANKAVAKRGRGRPRKSSKKKSTPYVKKNDPLGRGRPPKNAPKKTAAE